MIPLPIDPFIPSFVDALRQHRAAVLIAQPGAGKTTRVPPALLSAGPVVVLQPRRLAARATAARIAAERGWTLGEEVGWHIRFERRSSPRTRLLVVTEGILTSRLQSDPLLSDFCTVVIDEFHERSVHGDLALAMAAQAWRARDDLRLVVMSATLEAGPVAAFLDGCPVVEVPGRSFPLQVEYEPAGDAAVAALRQARLRTGDVLCFVAGAADVQRTIADIAGASRPDEVTVLPLYGALSSGEQDRVLTRPPSPIPRVVVATNIAETSLTVPGIRHLVDTGLHKVARYEASRGIDSLVIERIPRDAADQRAGRAGREAPGQVVRLWDPQQKLRPHREPEIHRVDLSTTVLDILAWGGAVDGFAWFDKPADDRIAAALHLLRRLGAVDHGRITPLGRRMQRLPLHPRLARMLLESNGHPLVARAAAFLSERREGTLTGAATSSDLWTALDGWDAAPSQVKRVAVDIRRLLTGAADAEGRDAVANVDCESAPMDDREFRRITFAGYPDRLARRRAPNSPRFKLASGIGAVLDGRSGVVDAEFVVALDLRSLPVPASEARRSSPSRESDVIYMASEVDADWLQPTATEIRHYLDEAGGDVRATQLERYDELVLKERPAPIDPEVAAALLVEEWLRRGPGEQDQRLLLRLAFAGLAVDLPALVSAAAAGRQRLREVQIARALDPHILARLERDAPDTLLVPSGRSVRLEYAADGSVSAAVKLQELFGLADTPRIGPHASPVLITLLAPNGRPVQITKDLRSFWDRTYPEVRRELRGRYPRHPWPEDPWRADPTWRTKRRT